MGALAGLAKTVISFFEKGGLLGMLASKLAKPASAARKPVTPPQYHDGVERSVTKRSPSAYGAMARDAAPGAVAAGAGGLADISETYKTK